MVVQTLCVFVVEPVLCKYFGFYFWPGALGFGQAGASQGDGVGLQAPELGLAADRELRLWK